MGMSSRFFNKKNKIRKIKLCIIQNVMEIKKLKKIKNFNYIQCYAMKKIEILIKNVVVKIKKFEK